MRVGVRYSANLSVSTATPMVATPSASSSVAMNFAEADGHLM